MQDFQAFLFTIWLDTMAKYPLLPGFVHAVFEYETYALLRSFKSPPGEDACHFGDIFLGVAAIHAQGVQFHKFAPVVLIQTAALALGLISFPVTLFA